MYGLIAHSGSTSHLFDRACAVAQSLGSVVRIVVSTDTVRIAALGESPAVTHTDSAVFYGSGAHVSCQNHTANGFLLDGAPDDVVAATLHDRDLIVAAGRGNHRLFVHDNATEVLCSTSLLVMARATHASVDRSYEDFMLGFGFYPETHTAYSGISALPAGTRWNATTKETTATAVIHPEVSTPESFDAAIPELRDRFFNALEEQAAGSTRHAVLLGGFDSMLVAASLRRMGHEVHTYTFTYNDAKYDQRNVAEFVQQMGIKHHPVIITPTTIAENLSSFSQFFSQPGALAHYQINTLVGSQQIARDDHKHIFSGDGCDALFLSFPTVNRRAALTKRLSTLPSWLLRGLRFPLRSGLTEKHLGHVGRTARAMIGNMMLAEPARGHLPNRYLDDYALSRLRRGPLPQQSETIESIRYRLASATENMDSAQRAFHGNGLTLQSRIKVDGSVASTGVPHFSPYTHPLVRSFVSHLPTDYRKNQSASPGDNGKELLVAMVRKYELLPEFLITQPKQSPADGPLDYWYMKDIRANIVTQLADLPFDWNPEYVGNLLRHKRAEDWYRHKVALNHHTYQAIGLLSSYASFQRALG
jgi:hypothetical protein